MTSPTTRMRDFSAEAFKAWMKRRGIKSGAVAAQILGCDKNAAYTFMKRGAPYYIGLACAAIENDLDMPPVDPSAPDTLVLDPDLYSDAIE